VEKRDWVDRHDFVNGIALEQTHSTNCFSEA